MPENLDDVQRILNVPHHHGRNMRVGVGKPPDTARVSAFGSQPDRNWRQATTVVRPQGPLLSKSTLPRPGDASDALPKLRVQR